MGAKRNQLMYLVSRVDQGPERKKPSQLYLFRDATLLTALLREAKKPGRSLLGSPAEIFLAG
jgi:hypothetical protein